MQSCSPGTIHRVIPYKTPRDQVQDSSRRLRCKAAYPQRFDTWQSSTNQLGQVARRLGRAPLFTARTLITLAIGVGANTMIFSVVEGVLLKRLPYPHSEQLIGVWHTAPGINIKELNMCPSIYFIDREQNATF